MGTMEAAERREEIVGPGAPVLPKTTRRVLTQRAVLWLGQTCNLRCYFCYFLNRIADAHHPEHEFMTLEKAKEICHVLRYHYGNTAIDIQGGEPTIHPGILDLIRYCREIGLIPTLITNGIHLVKPGLLEKFRDAGLRDFLVSLHGIGEIHDQVVGRPGAYEKITAAILRMRELGIPFRLNCTMSKPVVPIIPEIAQRAVEYGARAVNYIAFNPFEDQETGIRTHDNVARYTEIMPNLTKAIDYLEGHGIETNVRYVPMCMAEPRHRKNFYNFQQNLYDLHEWDYQSWAWTGLQIQRMKGGSLVPPFRVGRGSHRIMGRPVEWRDWNLKHPILGALGQRIQCAAGRIDQAIRGRAAVLREEAMLKAKHDARYQHPAACTTCSARAICDGFHGDYADFFGTDEARAITDVPFTDDPAFFIRNQEKIIEPEDQPWAL